MYHVNRSEVVVRATTGEAVLDLTSTGDKGTWGPAFVPHIVRAVSVALNGTPGSAGIVVGDLRPTMGSDTGRTSATVFSIALATTHTFTAETAQPVIYHVPSSPVTVYPGQSVVVECTDASAAVDGARVTFWVEPIYEVPANMSTIVSAITMSATS